MSNVDRLHVAVLQAAADGAIDRLPPLHRHVARALSDRTFALLLSLIDRIEKLEGKTP